MTTTYYKAVRPDGGSFRKPAFKWATEPGGVTEHPDPHRRDASGYLSVSVVPTDCTGMRWPCRLLEVEPVEECWMPDPDALPNKRAAYGFRTVRELPAHEVFGPQGEHVAALLDRIASLTRGGIERLNTVRKAARVAARDAARDAAWDAVRVAARDAARDAAWNAAWDAAWDAARDAARDAAWGAARGAARDAAVALLTRETLAPEYYETLTRHWRTIIGPLHPDDDMEVKG